jgi:hypothetical protein
MTSPAFIFVAPGMSGFALSKAKPDEGKRIFKKEFLYAGDFETDNLRFSAPPERLRKWKDTFDAYTANGNEVYMPLEHSGKDDPTKRRATVRRMEVEKNSKGLDALFGYVEFRDEQAERELKDAQCSIYVEHKVKDGKGNEYIEPITHVAFTDQPVIPGLEGWVLACARTPKVGAASMTIQELAGKCGVENAASLNDDAAFTAIATAFEQKTAKIAELEKLLTDNDIPLPGTDGTDGGDGGDEPPIKASRAQIGLLKDNRELKITALSQAGKITGVQAKSLREKYCTDKQCALALSRESGDDFDAVYETLQQNPSITGERSGPQAKLSREQRDKADAENPLLRDADRRAKEAAENR